MNLADFAGGVGAAAQGATQRQYAEQGLARGEMQNQQLGLQTAELQKQYEDLKGSREAFAGANSTQEGFDAATKHALSTGNLNLAMQVQQLQDTYNGNQLHHTAMQALSGAEPSEVMKTWQAYNPSVPIDTANARRVTAQDLAPGGELAGQTQYHPGDIISTRSDTGAPIHFPTMTMAMITGITKTPNFEGVRTGKYIFDKNTGTMIPAPDQPEPVKYKAPDGTELEIDLRDPTQYSALRSKVLTTLGGGPDAMNDKLSKEIFDMALSATNDPLSKLTPQERVDLAQKAVWVRGSGGHDEHGMPFNAATAIAAAQNIMSGKKSPADYGIAPQGVGAAAGQPPGPPPTPDSRWMVGANGQAAWHRPKPGAPGQWQIWTGAGAPVAPAAPAAPMAVPSAPGIPRGTPVTNPPAAGTTQVPIPASVRMMNRDQATARAQQLQQFLQSGQERSAPGFGFVTREGAQAELQAIQAWLPQAPPGPPAGYTAPPFQGPAGMPGTPGYAVGGVARAVKPSMVGGLARALGRQSRSV